MLMKFIRQYTIHTKADIRKKKKRKDNINVLLFLQALGCYNQFVFVGKEIYLNRKNTGTTPASPVGIVDAGPAPPSHLASQ